jgi:mannitol-1-phosphate 5-dehydrogenase
MQKRMTSKRRKILIYGAGATGRGFLAPIFNNLGYEIFFVDKNPELIRIMKSRNSYRTAFSKKYNYDIVKVNYSGAFLLGEEDKIISKVDFIFSCVGPNNVKDFAHKLKKAKTVISFENDIGTIETIKKLSENKNCYLGIVDVITSSTACGALLKIDPLCLISEKGDIAIEKGNFNIKELQLYNKENMQKYWNCKFYLHNTPHAAAAFLGKLCGIKYLHEAMGIPSIEFIVNSIMESTKEAMKLKKMADRDFIDFYAEKELERFKDELLFDPISRVGREPLRKLRENDRLIQSAKFITETGKDNNGIYIVIKAALHDAIKNYNKEAFDILKEDPTEEAILKKICCLKESDSLFKELTQKNLFNMTFSLFAKKKIVNFPGNILPYVTCH